MNKLRIIASLTILSVVMVYHFGRCSNAPDLIKTWQNDHTTFEIIKLSPERWKEYKDLRLYGLAESPLSVVKNETEMKAIKDDLWINYLKSALQEKKMYLLFAQVNGKIIGVSGALVDDFEKMKHRALIISIYVLPEFRKQGVAKELLQALMDRLAQNGIAQVRLFVETQNDDAIGLYKSLGFKTVALCEKYINLDGVYYDQYMMSKELSIV